MKYMIYIQNEKFNKMKVLHILNELKFSGAEIMYVDAAPIFQKKGCDLFVVNTTENLGEYAIAFEQKGYKVFHIPYPDSKKKISARADWCKKMIQLIKNENIDIVHIHSARLRFDMSFCAWIAGVKSIYTFHNVFSTIHWYKRVYGIAQRFIVKNLFGCKFQTISDSVFCNEKYYWHNNTTLIYNWYNSYRFYPAEKNEKEKIRKELDISNESLVVISVGGCSPIKRHSDIIKSLPQLIKTYPNTVYIHLGNGISLDDEMQLAKTLNVSKNIRFYGNQVDVRKFLIASDIYVMPSKYEGISITTIESMACKIPAILYNVPGLRDFNKEKECSILVKEDYNLLAEAIFSLYKDKETQERLIFNAKSFVDTKFNIKKNALEIFGLYKSMLE